MPKSKEQYEEIRLRSKEAIVKAALKLFAENGYHTTSISTIAREANVAVGLMYHYFKSKEDLLVFIIEDHLGRIGSLAANRLAQDSDIRDIRIIIDALFQAVSQSSDSWKLVITVMFQPDVAESARKRFEELTEQQHRLYEKYFKEIGAARPEDSARTLGAVMHGALLAYALSSDEIGLRLIRENVIERLLKSGV